MTFIVQRDVDLQPYNTMSLAVRANYFAQVKNPQDICEAIAYAHSSQLPVCVLGGGSNVIFANDYPGLVVVMANKGIHLLEENRESVLVNVAAGEVWDEFLQYCLQQQWYGLENLAIIPGTVGAAPVQNIGAYGQEVADCIESVNVIDFDDGQQRCLSRQDCGFAYRDSVFKHHLQGLCVIASVTFRLQKTFIANISYKALADELLAGGAKAAEKITPAQVRDAVIHIRRAKLPSPDVVPNCGSFFKNPVVGAEKALALKSEYPAMPVYAQDNGEVKLAAGWLIEQAGWKGRQLGPVGVYKDQALVLVNYADATYADLDALIVAVKAAVWQKFAVELEQEPVLIKAA